MIKKCIIEADAQILKPKNNQRTGAICTQK